ncbi:MAG: MBL fold metallo-hydrolase, partial [Shimia sp.]
MRIEFVNHASVLVTSGETALLTDPWYSGPAFHKGWELLVETPDTEVDALLDRVTDIWLSHEHPDHFSIPFYKRFGAKLIARGIPVWFQRTKDQRVASFLRKAGITV